MIGTVLEGKYRIDALIGKGGYGAVFRACQVQLDRTVAIKVMRERRDEPEHAERFVREALAVARLKHPNIITVYDYGVDDRIGAFIVMEYLEGRSLRQELQSTGALALPFAVALARQIALAAHAAHSAGIIHRDIKPENVFLEDVGDGRLAVKVLDFGIARLSQTRDLDGAVMPSLTGEHDLIGTFLYVAPEQATDDDVDARADVYSIGCVLYEMLTGSPPFTGHSPMAVILRHSEELPVPPIERAPHVPAALSDIVVRTLEKDPGNRYASALELADALEFALADIELHLAATGGIAGGRTAGGAAGSSERASFSSVPSDDRITKADVPNNLPRAPTSFVGRERECAEVLRQIASHRFVTLTGPGGIGKTRLALKTASEVSDRVAGGIWFLDLAPVTDPALVARTVATVLGVREDPGVPVADTIAASWRDREALLVLDNCEHVLEACADLVETLQVSCAGIRVLATSREPLGVDGETVWAVPSLGVPDARQSLATDGFLELDAVRLFVDRARLAVNGFAPDVGEAALIGELCRRLDGLPLAIELAAARIRVLSVAQIADRLGDRFRLLAQRGASGSDRQRTLRATIDWSYDLLDDAERAMLNRLSVFAGGFTLEAVERVCATDNSDAIDALDRLTNLVAKSLVVVDWHADGNRFRLLESIRQYAAEKLTEGGEAAVYRARHFAHFRDLTSGGYAKLGGAEGEEYGRVLDAEFENVRLALEAAKELDDPKVLFEMAMELWRFWYQRGHLAEGREWMEAALAKAGDVLTPGERSKALGRVGNIVVDQGDIEAGTRYHEEAIRIDRELGDQSGIAIGLHNLGNVVMLKGEFDEAARLFDESYAILLDIGDDQRTALSLVNRGTVAMERGAYAEAMANAEEAIATFRRIGSGYGESLAMASMCEVVARAGDVEALGPLLDETIELSRKLDNKHNLATIARLRGVIAASAGDTLSAKAHGEEALSIFREIGDRHCAVETLANLSEAALAEGDTDRAYALVTEGLATANRIGLKRHLARCLERVADVAIAWNREDRAAELLGAAEALRERIGGPAPALDVGALERMRAQVGGHVDSWRLGREEPSGNAVATAMTLTKG